MTYTDLVEKRSEAWERKMTAETPLELEVETMVHDAVGRQLLAVLEGRDGDL